MTRLSQPLALLVLLCAPLAAADDAPAAPPEEVAAVQVRAAVATGDTAVLKKLAARDDPDPWRVVDALLAGGRHEDAASFVAAAEARPGVEGLAKYVAAHGGRSTASRKALRAMNAAFAARAPEQALAASEVLAGEIDAGMLASVPRLRLAHGRGLALRMLRKYRESVRILAQAAQAAAKLGWLRFAATGHWEAGSSAWAGGWRTGAVGAWTEGLEPLRRLGDDARVATILNAYVAKAQVALGDDAGALASYAEAGRILKERGDGLGLARSLLGQGDAEQRRGNLSAAYGHYEAALALPRIRLYRPHGPLAFYGMANVLRKLGSYELALTRYDEARTLFKLTKDRRGEALVLSGVGNTQQRLGKYPEALKLHNQALTVFFKERILPGVAASLNNVANVQLQLGKHKEAVSGYKAALAIYEKQENQRFAARVLKNLGSVERDSGHAEEARSYYVKAEALFRTLKDRAGLASTLNDLGSLALRFAKDTKQARIHYDEALGLFRALDDTPGVAMVLNNVGNSYERDGTFDKAGSQYEEALRLLKTSPNPSTHVNVLWSLAWLRFRQAKPAEAAALARQGITMVSQLASGLAEGEGASARDVFRDLFDVGVRASLAANDEVMQTWMFEQGRADTLRKGLASRSALEAAVVPEAFRLALAKAQARERSAVRAHALALKSGLFKRIRAAGTEKEAAEADVVSAIAQIQREAKAAAQLVLPEADGPERIRGYLRGGEALISYGLTDGAAVALVVTKDGTRMVPLGSSADVRRYALAFHPSDRAVKEKAMKAATGELRKRLVAPLKLGKTITRVLISPVEVLGYLPFAMLFEDHEVAYVPSGTTYGLLRKQQSVAGKGVLALGAPDYTTHAQRLDPLQETAKEVEKIGTVKLLGKRASEADLAKALRLAARWRAVHFACHGLVDPERPWRSSLALTVDGAHDGFLTCLEIFRMQIPTDLVVLSACETGKGKIYKTEGIVGLTRAFMFAGAPRVICSLWKVDDEATRELMLEFYRLWNPEAGKQAMTPVQALRAAQKHVRNQKKWQHPYYWAAWVLWGLPE